MMLLDLKFLVWKAYIQVVMKITREFTDVQKIGNWFF